MASTSFERTSETTKTRSTIPSDNPNDTKIPGDRDFGQILRAPIEPDKLPIDKIPGDRGF